MIHPNVAEVLAKLDPSEQEVVRHALSCPRCSSGLRGPLCDEVIPAPLTQEALAELTTLEDQLERIAGELRSFSSSLCQSTTGLVVRARLECLLADRFEPGIRDLESIVETARGDLPPVECQ